MCLLRVCENLMRTSLSHCWRCRNDSLSLSCMMVDMAGNSSSIIRWSGWRTRVREVNATPGAEAFFPIFTLAEASVMPSAFHGVRAHARTSGYCVREISGLVSCFLVCGKRGKWVARCGSFVKWGGPVYSGKSMITATGMRCVSSSCRGPAPGG